MDHKTFLRFLLKGNLTFLDVPSSQQREYLYSLPEPKNDIKRSFYQYKCHNFFAPKWKPILLDIGALFFYFPILLFYIVKGLFVGKKKRCEAISDLNGMQEVIPNVVLEKYQVSFVGKNPIGALCFSDIPFVLSIFFSCFPACFFSMKAAMKVAQYSQLIRWYSPKCIIAHLEYSFSSSLLTAYCNKCGVRHINVMHGEKMFNIVDAFFSFDECYVWGEHYVNLFTDLRAEGSQFRVAVPPSLCIDTHRFYNSALWSDYKYYLADFTEEEIKSIVSSMAFAHTQGKTVKYRFHPRYDRTALINKYIAPTDIEDPHKVSIQESVSSCDVAVGSYSTVLNQAYCSGKKVILDDVTYCHQYEKFKDLRYCLIEEGCPRLSSLQ